jgi:hypothetical protein
MERLNILLEAARDPARPGTTGRELLLRMTRESSATALSMLYEARQDVPVDAASRILLENAIEQVEIAVVEIARELESLAPDGRSA